MFLMAAFRSSLLNIHFNKVNQFFISSNLLIAVKEFRHFCNSNDCRLRNQKFWSFVRLVFLTDIKPQFYVFYALNVTPNVELLLLFPN